MSKTDFEIVGYDATLYDSFIKFNEKMYKRRDTKKYFEHRFIKHPYINGNPNMVIAIQGEDIVGHSLYPPMRFKSKGKVYNGFWGQDLIAAPEVRRIGVGKKLVDISKTIPDLFVIGLTPISKKIYARHKFHMYDFVKLAYLHSVFTIFRIHFLKPKRKKIYFPQLIRTNKAIFEKQAEAPKLNKEFWNESFVEFSRDYKFLKWRFFELYNDFHFYLRKNDTDSPEFFVVKLMEWNKFNFLLLVDYRLNIEERTSVKTLIKSIKKLVKETGASGVICGCSVNLFKDECLKAGFFEFESPSSIMVQPDTPEKFPELIKGNIFATMADTDFENLYHLDGNLHHRMLKGKYRFLRKRFQKKQK